MGTINKRWTLLCLAAFVALFTLYQLNFLDTDLDSVATVVPADQRHEASTVEVAAPFDWSTREQLHPLRDNELIPLPRGKASKIPKVQARFALESVGDRFQRQHKLKKIKNAFLHAWKGYKQHAWLRDELSPLSGKYKTTFGGWGATLVDTLDTLWIMGLTKEFDRAVAAVEEIDFTRSQTNTISVFETTIRYLGGLLSAYDISNGRHPVLLDKAVELGNMLYAAFDTPNRMPVSYFDLKASSKGLSQEALSGASVADVGSLTLEFTRLTQLTGNPKFYDAVQRITDLLERQQNQTRLPGLFPMRVDVKNEVFITDGTFTFGAMADSVYEYLVKEHLLIGGRSDQYRNMYETAMTVAKERVFFKPMHVQDSDILFPGTLREQTDNIMKLDPEAQHLACFIGGMVALGAKAFETHEDIELGRRLTDGCVWAYESMPSHIMPEIMKMVPCEKNNNCRWNEVEWVSGIAELHHMRDDKDMTAIDRAREYANSHCLPKGVSDVPEPKYMLRPEAFESIFIMYRLTGNRKWQEKAWAMFKAIEKHTKTSVAHAALEDVTSANPTKMDLMESFWTAETLKYLYLTFDEPDHVDLDEFVFNTEAHPLRRS